MKPTITKYQNQCTPINALSIIHQTKIKALYNTITQAQPKSKPENAKMKTHDPPKRPKGQNQVHPSKHSVQSNNFFEN